jgi:hypothetical protein
VNPAREIEQLRGPEFRQSALSFEGDRPLPEVTSALLDITAEFEPGSAPEFGLMVRGVPVTYNVRDQELSCLGRKGPLIPVEGKVRLRLLVDRASIEIFGNGGSLYMPMGTVLDTAKPPLALFARWGEVRRAFILAYPLKSIWR